MRTSSKTVAMPCGAMPRESSRRAKRCSAKALPNQSRKVPSSACTGTAPVSSTTIGATR